MRAKLADNSGAPFTVNWTRALTSPRHRDGGHTTYQVDFSSFAGNRPSGLPSNYQVATFNAMMEASMSDAEKAWEDKVGNILSKVPSGADVRVTAFWDGAGSTLGCKRATAIACVRTPSRYAYPHLPAQRMMFRVPPKPLSSGRLTEWTSDPTKMVRGNMTYYFFPRTAAHEFGHTMGLADTYTTTQLMGHHLLERGSAAPTKSDEDAMKEVAQQHSSRH